jgi:hypothetical protein
MPRRSNPIPSLPRTLTPAECKALQAVADGKVSRFYHARGNVLRSAEVSSQILWSLSNAGFMCDGQNIGGSHYIQVLTALGEVMLKRSG